jgi:hypothetical protein
MCACVPKLEGNHLSKEGRVVYDRYGFHFCLKPLVLLFQFIPWKKLYLSYSLNVEESTAFLDQLCDSYNITGVQNCLRGLIL